MRRVARATSGAVLGLGCVFGVTARAANWSVAPNLDWSVDTDSDRSLVPQGSASQSTSVSTNLDISVVTETTRLTASPSLRWQLFDTKAYGNIFERDLSAADLWTGERITVNASAKDGDNSTLSTEATQTGILSSNLHQRLDLASVSATYNETERYALVLSTDYSDVSYYGTAQSDQLNLLSGYRYFTGSIGEKAQLGETSSLTVTAYRNKDISRLPGNDTLQTGAQAEYHRSFSERLNFDASLGGARIQSLKSTQTSTTGSLNVSRSYELGSIAIAYSRSLTPYGSGTLVQRQQLSLSATRNLRQQLTMTAAASRVQNGSLPGQSEDGGQTPQVQTYINTHLGLDWAPGETWRIGGELDWTRTRAEGLGQEPVHDWHASVSLIWTPQPYSTSF